MAGQRWSPWAAAGTYEQFWRYLHGRKFSVPLLDGAAAADMEPGSRYTYQLLTAARWALTDPHNGARPVSISREQLEAIPLGFDHNTIHRYARALRPPFLCTYLSLDNVPMLNEVKGAVVTTEAYAAGALLVDRPMVIPIDGEDIVIGEGCLWWCLPFADTMGDGPIWGPAMIVNEDGFALQGHVGETRDGLDTWEVVNREHSH